jgi:hypothetical protein
MKAIYTTVLSLLSGTALASPHPQQGGGGLMGGLVTGFVNAGYGKVADVPGAVARKTTLESRAKHIEGAKSIKIRYGPYKVPNGMCSTEVIIFHS